MGNLSEEIGAVIVALLTGGAAVELVRYWRSRRKDKSEAQSRRDEAELQLEMSREKLVADIAAQIRSDAQARVAAADEQMKQYTQALTGRVDILERDIATCRSDRERLQQEITELRILVIKTEDKTGTAVIVIDEYGIIREWNSRAVAIFKYTLDEALGQHVSMIIPARFHAMHEEAVLQSNETGVLRDLTFRDLMGQDSGGQEVPISIRLSIIERRRRRHYRAEVRQRSALLPAEEPSSPHSG